MTAYASGLYQAPEEVKVRALLCYIGPQACVVLSSICKGSLIPKTYDEVKSILEGHFIHPANEVYESSRFHRRIQLPGESVDGFYTILRDMVKKCNYQSEELQDRLVRDRFVVGLSDMRLSDLLGRNPKLTLNEALIQARQFEDAEKEKRSRENGDSPLDIDDTKISKSKADNRPLVSILR